MDKLDIARLQIADLKKQIQSLQQELAEANELIERLKEMMCNPKVCAFNAREDAIVENLKAELAGNSEQLEKGNDDERK